MFERILACLAAITLLCSGGANAQTGSDFAAARASVKTTIHYRGHGKSAPTPPAGVFSKVTYPSAVGPLVAYLTPDPGDRKHHPAIIWMTGGETNTIGDVWTAADRTNDQSAAQYRRAGIVMMFPSLRGGNANPGKVEGFFGEIDDVIAAADYLAKQPYVDPNRIYLGGHSTGGTLVMLTAAATDRFRAVFAFGPVDRAEHYGQDLIPADFNKAPAWEAKMRAPVEWLASVRAPLTVIEGTQGNIIAFSEMRTRNTNPKIQFVEVSGASHFNVLAPANEKIARAILADTGAAPASYLTAKDIEPTFPPAPQSDLPFDRRATPEQLLELYPLDALRAGKAGIVRVRCVVQADLSLGQCTIASEEPTGLGFGDAAMAAMKYFSVPPKTRSGVATVGGSLTIPIRFSPPF